MFGCAFWYAGRKSLKNTALRPALSAQRIVSGSVGSFAPVFGSVSPLAVVVAPVAGGAGALVGWLTAGAGAAGALVHAASAAAAATAPLPMTNSRRLMT